MLLVSYSYLSNFKNTKLKPLKRSKQALGKRFFWVFFVFRKLPILAWLKTPNYSYISSYPSPQAKRRILSKPTRHSRSMSKQKRPRSRTLTAVHDSILEDLCYPAEVRDNIQRLTKMCDVRMINVRECSTYVLVRLVGLALIIDLIRFTVSFVF